MMHQTAPLCDWRRASSWVCLAMGVLMRRQSLHTAHLHGERTDTLSTYLETMDHGLFAYDYCQCCCVWWRIR